jgi:hypothetical protein
VTHQTGHRSRKIFFSVPLDSKKIEFQFAVCSLLVLLAKFSQKNKIGNENESVFTNELNQTQLSAWFKCFHCKVIIWYWNAIWSKVRFVVSLLLFCLHQCSDRLWFSDFLVNANCWLVNRYQVNKFTTPFLSLACSLHHLLQFLPTHNFNLKLNFPAKYCRLQHIYNTKHKHFWSVIFVDSVSLTFTKNYTSE